MGPDDGAHSPVEVDPEGGLLARHFAMEVDEADRGQRVRALVEKTVGIGEGVLDRDHVGAALEVQDGDVGPVRGDVGAPATTRHALGPVVVRSQDPLVAVEGRQDLLLVPDVIARGDDIHARPVERLGGGRGEAHPSGQVLAVGGDEVHAVEIPQAGELPLDGLAARPADHVADHQDPAGAARPRVGHAYFAYSTERVSRITVTLIWPG